MRIKVYYIFICILLFSSCGISSFSSRTTSKNLYQHGHFKKPKDFKFKRTRNEQKQFVPTDNSTLDISKELGIKQDSTISEEKPLEIALPTLKTGSISQKEHKLIETFKSITNPEKDTTLNKQDVITKELKRAHIEVIIGAVLSHLGLGLYAGGLVFLLDFGLSSSVVLFLIFGILCVVSSFILLILAFRELNYNKRSGYTPIAVISFIFSILGLVVALAGLIALFLFTIFSM